MSGAEGECHLEKSATLGSEHLAQQVGAPTVPGSVGSLGLGQAAVGP